MNLNKDMRRLRTGFIGLAIAACILPGQGIAQIPPALGPLKISSSGLQIEGRDLEIRSEERLAIDLLDSAARGHNLVEQDRALRNAIRVAASPDARYAVGFYNLYIARVRRSSSLRGQALDLLIGSESTPRGELSKYLAERGQIAFKAGDYRTASDLWTRVLDSAPENPEAMVHLAQARLALNDNKGAADLIRRGIGVRRHARELAPETWYRQRLSIAYNGKLIGDGIDAAHELVEAYPTAANWRFALRGYWHLAAPKDQAEIDFLRLMRAAGALAQRDEYYRLAQLLLHSDLAGEADAVLDEGLKRRIIKEGEAPTPQIRTEIKRAIARGASRIARVDVEEVELQEALSKPADRLLGQGRYDEAIASYRSALQLNGGDLALRTRLATALALGGYRDQAEPAFRAVSVGANASDADRTYGDLARFWLNWLREVKLRGV